MPDDAMPDPLAVWWEAVSASMFGAGVELPAEHRAANARLLARIKLARDRLVADEGPAGVAADPAGFFRRVLGVVLVDVAAELAAATWLKAWADELA